jgi:hypothetical protein
LKAQAFKDMGNVWNFRAIRQPSLFPPSRPRRSSGNANSAGRSSAKGARSTRRRKDFVRGMADAKKRGTGPSGPKKHGKVSYRKSMKIHFEFIVFLNIKKRN